MCRLIHRVLITFVNKMFTKKISTVLESYPQFTNSLNAIINLPLDKCITWCIINTRGYKNGDYEFTIKSE